MNKIFIHCIVLLLCSSSVFGQSTLISGTITGIENEATVFAVSNPALHVKVTDRQFRISIKNVSDTLIISAPGYQTVSFAVNATTPLPLVIVMTIDNKALQEVIVNTGYQKIAKERATGSFTTVDNKLLNQQVGTTVLDKLESISNGLYVDRQTTAKPRFIIRGLSTINGPASPLIVLNDFPYDGDLNNINPNDVENITILKDAAAASIWGTRAGNGVIVITTKRGRFNQPMKIEFTSNATITNKPDLRYIPEISPVDFIGVEKYLYNKGYYNAQLNGTPWKAVSPVIELLYQRDQGKITASEAESRINALGNHNLTDQLLNYVYDKGFSLQQAVSVSGGAKNMLWSMGGGWDHNIDQLNAKYNRYNFRTAQTFRLTSRLELITSLDYTQSESESGKQGYGLATNTGFLPVYTQIRDQNGNALPVGIDYRNSYADSAGGGKLLDWGYYPLTDADHIHSNVKEQAILANIGLSYTLLKGFTFTAKYQYGRQLTTGRRLTDEGSYEARNYINTFTTIDADGNVTYNLPRGGIYFEDNATLETQNFRGQGSYNKRWGRHEINAIAGGEWRQKKYNSSSLMAAGYNPDLLGTQVPLDYVNPYPNFLTGDAENLPGGSSFAGTVNNYISFFSNAAYTFSSKYTLSASARRDASNLFGASKNNRWTPLWSAGLAWDISREAFYKSGLIPRLKLRATYGTSGNADPLRSAVTTLRFQFPSPFTQSPASQIVQYENRHLGWERVATGNVGIDFSTRNDRINGSVEFYHKKATNLFGYALVDYTGIPNSTIIKNVATMVGHGVDIDLSSQNLTGKFGWSSQLNVNLNKDKVKKYYLLNQGSSSFVGGGAKVSAIEGAPVYALYSYQWAGLDSLTGDPRGYLNGVVSKDYNKITSTGTSINDLVYHGPTLPVAVISLGNTFSYKRMSVSVRITGKFGNYFRRRSINYNSLYRMRTGHSDYSLRWQNPGDEMYTNVPSMSYPLNQARESFYQYSSVLATKADFVRLQYITLSYDLKKVQCYININNLGILWRANKFGIDPEYNSGYPVATNIAIGIKATF